MRIWHVGATRSIQTNDGINPIIWSLAAAQAAEGHDVILLVGERPDLDIASSSRRAGISLLHLPCDRMRFDPRPLADRLRDEKPDVVHMHSAMVPRHATLAHTLLKMQVPYIVTPHGAIANKGTGWRRGVYARLIERPRLRRSSAITVAGPREQEQVETILLRYRNELLSIASPVQVDSLEGHDWKPAESPRKLVFVGRLDVENRRIDLLMEIARQLPAVELHLYGQIELADADTVNQLRRTMPANVFFHEPAGRADKAEVLIEATLLLQMSRCNELPVSAGEAMYLGVPCALNENLDIAAVIREKDLGLLLPEEPIAAARKIAWAIEHPDRLKEWGHHGRLFAQSHLRPDKVAAEYVRLYRRALPMPRPSIFVDWITRAANAVGLIA